MDHHHHHHHHHHRQPPHPHPQHRQFNHHPPPPPPPPPSRMYPPSPPPQYHPHPQNQHPPSFRPPPPPQYHNHPPPPQQPRPPPPPPQPQPYQYISPRPSFPDSNLSPPHSHSHSRRPFPPSRMDPHFHPPPPPHPRPAPPPPPPPPQHHNHHHHYHPHDHRDRVDFPRVRQLPPEPPRPSRVSPPRVRQLPPEPPRPSRVSPPRVHFHAPVDNDRVVLSPDYVRNQRFRPEFVEEERFRRRDFVEDDVRFRREFVEDERIRRKDIVENERIRRDFVEIVEEEEEEERPRFLREQEFRESREEYDRRFVERVMERERLEEEMRDVLERERHEEEYRSEIVEREYERSPRYEERDFRGRREESNVDVRPVREGSRYREEWKERETEVVSRRYVERGRREEGEISRSHSPKVVEVQKKSAFLRLQPAVTTTETKHNGSSSRNGNHGNNNSNRSGSNTPSPLKGKGKGKGKGRENAGDLLDSPNSGLSDERKETPVKLDVSSKSTGLVAKVVGREMDTKIGNDKVSETKKEEIQSDNKVRFSFVKKKVALSSTSGSSVFSGGRVKETPKAKDLGKDNDNEGAEKGVLSSARKKRKSDVSLSPLSGSVTKKVKARLGDENTSVGNGCGSSVADISGNKSEKGLHSSGQVEGSAKSDMIMDAGSFDLNKTPNDIVVGEDVRHSPSEASSPKRTGKRGKIVIGADRNSDGNMDETISIDKFDSETGTYGGDGQGQIMPPVLVDNGSGLESSGPLVSVGSIADNADIRCCDVDIENETGVSNSIYSKVEELIVAEKVGVLASSVNENKYCGTQVIQSLECGIIEPRGNSTDNVGINCRAAFEDSEDMGNSESIPNIDVDYAQASSSSCSHDNAVSVDFENPTSTFDIMAANVLLEQPCRDQGITLDNDDKRGEGIKDSIFVEGDYLKMDEQSVNTERKSESEQDNLNSGLFDSFHDGTVTSTNCPLKDPNSPVGDPKSAAAVSPSRKAESDVVHALGKTARDIDGVICMNHGYDSDAIGYPSNCSKRRKTSSFESAFSDASASESHDLPMSTDSLIAIDQVPSDSQSAEEATDSFFKADCSLHDSFNPDFLRKDPCESPKHRIPMEQQPAHLSESGNEHNEFPNMVIAGATGEIKLVPPKHVGGNMIGSHDGGEQFTKVDPSMDVDHRSVLVTNMECEDSRAGNGTLSSVSGPSCEGNVDSELCQVKSILVPTEAVSVLASTSKFAVPAVNVTSDGKLAVNESHSSELIKTKATNYKLGISAAANDRLLPQISASLPPKIPKNLSSSSGVSKQVIGRNVLTRADTSFSSGSASSVITPARKGHLNFPAKPRTWRRTDNIPASNASLKKPLVGVSPPQKPPIIPTVKTQANSYIRKGNSLVRNPAPVKPAASAAIILAPRVSGASTSFNQLKPKDSGGKGKLTVTPRTVNSTAIPDSLNAGGRNITIEMPKTPPLPYSGTSSKCEIDVAMDCRSLPLAGQSGAADKVDTTESRETASSPCENPGTVDRNVEDAGSLSDGNFPPSKPKRVVYIKRKSNQLVAASSPLESSVSKMDASAALSSDNSYFKRKKNQLIRGSSESNIHRMDARVSSSFSCRNSSTKRHSSKGKLPKLSLVWKLGDSRHSGKGVDAVRCRKIVSHLLPWKKATYWRSVWRSSVSCSGVSSFTKIRRLLSPKKRAAVYVRSARGFSLKRSKVISLSGSSLKWSKSMERRSKKVNQEASRAVSTSGAVETLPDGAAAGERIFRIGVFRYRMDSSRRTLQRISDEESADTAASQPERAARKAYVPKRLLIGSNEYIRIGNGNQLVRDPKRRTRILASEKVRWSLHTARMRLAKKRKFCLFFTRFGRCNKGEGKCPFVHDPTKIAVCTKFLNGLCRDPNCQLTHKVIPERMPDCSFFLQGMCSNENCSYRHVNVNPKASICGSFLRGYCAEGNECRKKHSYICPEFEATGSCSQASKCKLYHPKKGKGKKRKFPKERGNGRGRYFGSGRSIVPQPDTGVAEQPSVSRNDSPSPMEQDLGDYISLDVSDDEFEENNVVIEATDFSDGECSNFELDDLDVLIKPLQLLSPD